MIGNLITSKQIISYAKWYLSSPLKNSTPIGYKPRDIKEIKKTIHYAKSHPKALFFGPNSKSPHYSGYYADCFGYEPRYDFINVNDAYQSVSDYLKALKRQTIVSYIDLLRQAKAINRKIDRHNAVITAHNEICNRHIRQIAKVAGLHHLDSSLYNDPATNTFHNTDEASPFDTSSRNSFAVTNEAEKVSAKFSMDLTHNPKSFSVNEMTGQVYYHSVPVNAHGSVAYWASDKKPLTARIDISRIPHEPVFKRDISYGSLTALSPSENRINIMYITSPYEIADYKNFIQK